jgi:hypothetical protein
MDAVAHQAAHHSWLEKMKSEARSDPRLQVALSCLFGALGSPEIAACQTAEDFERLVAEIDARSSLRFASWQGGKLRQRMLTEYLERGRKLHGQRFTRRQICEAPAVDESDFRKFLKGLKFRPESAVAQRITEFLVGDKPPL